MQFIRLNQIMAASFMSRRIGRSRSPLNYYGRPASINWTSTRLYNHQRSLLTMDEELELRNAVYEDEINVFHDVLKQIKKRLGSDIDTKSLKLCNGDSLMHCSIKGYSPIIFKALLKDHFDSTGDSGITPLMMSIIHERVDMAKDLICTGANLYKVDYIGRSALHFAVDVGNTKIVKELCQKSDMSASSDYGTVVNHACNRLDVEVLKILLDNGAPLYVSGQIGRPLFTICNKTKEDPNLMRCYNLLVSSGVDLNEVFSGSTPIHSAVLNNQTALVKSLLKFSVSIDTKNSLGLNVLNTVKMFNPNLLSDLDIRWPLLHNVYAPEDPTLKARDILIAKSLSTGKKNAENSTEFADAINWLDSLLVFPYNPHDVDIKIRRALVLKEIGRYRNLLCVPMEEILRHEKLIKAVENSRKLRSGDKLALLELESKVKEFSKHKSQLHFLLGLGLEEYEEKGLAHIAFRHVRFLNRPSAQLNYTSPPPGSKMVKLDDLHYVYGVAWLKLGEYSNAKVEFSKCFSGEFAEKSQKYSEFCDRVLFFMHWEKEMSVARDE